MTIEVEGRDEIRQLSIQISRKSAALHRPLVVVVDGPSGVGKSTLAAQLAEELGAALIPLDDFFTGDIPDAQWDGFSVRPPNSFDFVLDTT